jgi:drug/metabolite transporter (DMT)-like permease
MGIALESFVALAAFLFRARIRAAYRDIRVRLARLNSFLHERITLRKTLAVTMALAGVILVTLT